MGEESPGRSPTGVAASPPARSAAADERLHLAIQSSEPRRLCLLLVVIALACGTDLVRHFTGGKVMQGQTFVLRMALLAITGVYALALLRLVRRANGANRLLPVGLWAATTAFEALVPTIAVAEVVISGRESRLDALSAPAILLYGIVIALSIVRMRPWLCLVSGGVCAGGHACLVVRALVTTQGPLTPGQWPYYSSYPIYLAVTGVAAAVLSREVREYFRAAMREAEARRQLDLVHQEVEIAATIQQGLMPTKPPEIPGFDVAGWNRPAEQTGGDYFDWQILPDGRLVVVIADVTGHGLGPALLMAVCRAYTRACVPVGPELRSALRRVNSLLHEDVSEGRFVTLAVSIMHPQTGECELLSAGHGPLLRFRAADRRIDEFNGDGVPLAILEDEDYGSPQRLHLDPGDALMFVTDGFFEWANPRGEQYGLPRLREFLERNGGMDARAMIERLDEDVRAFGAGVPQGDDMTAVVIRRLPAA
ncbi:MAG: serine/threonine-protein phosphatase [Phycisphaerae bacterium]|nr:serine/threonine-protein phosphatase [Phycisphaerae bacterium]